MPSVSPEDQWIAIQHKTFANWANEQLSSARRRITDLSTDLKDGVCLVALVEALQRRRVGKVYAKPATDIHKLHNVTLALEAIQHDKVRLVNIGTEDVVAGNLKLILGLLWHLIIRYQISASTPNGGPNNAPSGVAAKRMMLSWFQSVLPELSITNFTTSWRDGRALHALIEYCKPGLAPDWRSLHPKDRVLNCRQAMQLAKKELSVPEVISAEDFSSSDLDELSALTYLSYFTRKNSPGYEAMLTWLRKQLKTNVPDLSTSWNNGHYLCILVQSKGGVVPGWPDNVDTSNHLSVCQLGLTSAEDLGIKPILSASELSSPNLDHLALMAYLAQFQNATPRSMSSPVKVKVIKVDVTCQKSTVKVHQQALFELKVSDPDLDKSKFSVKVKGPGTGTPACEMHWSSPTTAKCSVTAKTTGLYKVEIHHPNAVIQGSPLNITMTPDLQEIKFKGYPNPVMLGHHYYIDLHCSPDDHENMKVKVTSPTEQDSTLDLSLGTHGLSTSFHPNHLGDWKIQVFLKDQQVREETLKVFDNKTAVLIGPTSTYVGQQVVWKVDVHGCGTKEVDVDIQDRDGQIFADVDINKANNIYTVTFTPLMTDVLKVSATTFGHHVKGSPLLVEVMEPIPIDVRGEGLNRCVQGTEASFTVDTHGMPGDVSAVVEVSGQHVPVQMNTTSQGLYQVRYVPPVVGLYKVSVLFNGTHIVGSPFECQVTNKQQVRLIDSLDGLKDEQDHIALAWQKPFTLQYDVSTAGPGSFKADVLGPSGRVPVQAVVKNDVASLSFTPGEEGDHHIHVYWSNTPLETSPILCYCPGPPLPLNAEKVIVEGKGAKTARATVAATFVINGKMAGPGVPKVRLQGVQTDIPVTITPLQYDRYRCHYTSRAPGSFLLYVSWSDKMVPGSPFKINISPKGDVSKVKVTGEGLKGGIVGNEVKLFVDTTSAGAGDITAVCQCSREPVNCDVKESAPGQYTLRILPVQPERHLLHILFDDEHVPGSPFYLRIGEPPDPSKVKVFGPGILNGILDWFESRFLVETYGAGAGQLAVKIRGPRGAFRVDMRRESESERTITCRYDPSEPGEYIIHVRWSGVHVIGSPFTVHLVETQEELWALNPEQKGAWDGTGSDGYWSAEI